MARAAWVVEASGPGPVGSVALKRAWVFPDGLKVGRPVQYSSSRVIDVDIDPDTESDLLHRTPSEIVKWAVGEVAGIEGDVVKLAWSGAVKLEANADWDRCYATGPPPGKLFMEDILCEFDGDSDYDRGEATDAEDLDISICGSPDAFRDDEHAIEWDRWAVERLPTQTFVARVVSHDEFASGLVRVELVTLSGDRFDVQLNFNYVSRHTVNLMAAIARERQLGLVKVHVMSSDGVLMHPNSELPF